jgi:DNA-binding GntR family transcriptional regulator
MEDRNENAAGQFYRPATVLEAVLSELRRAISSGEMSPGERVFQEALAAQLGVSRVPIREALYILQGEGRLNHVPNYGYYVVSLSSDDLRELVDARGVLEDAAIRQALRQITPDDIDRLEKIIGEISRAIDEGSSDKIQKGNREFHLELVRVAKRPHFDRLIEMLWDMTNPYHNLYFTDSSGYDRVKDEHAGIMDLIRSRDERGLLSALEEHRRHAIEAVIGELERRHARENDQVPTSADESGSSESDQSGGRLPRGETDTRRKRASQDARPLTRS